MGNFWSGIFRSRCFYPGDRDSINFNDSQWQFSKIIRSQIELILSDFSGNRWKAIFLEPDGEKLRFDFSEATGRKKLELNIYPFWRHETQINSIKSWNFFWFESDRKQGEKFSIQDEIDAIKSRFNECMESGIYSDNEILGRRNILLERGIIQCESELPIKFS